MDEQRTFLPSDRLHKRREFLRVYEEGVRLHSRSFVMYVLPTEADRARLGLTISRRIGRAVVRNRIRRRLREIFRSKSGELPCTCDVVINARRIAADTPYHDLNQEFTQTLDRWKRHKRRD